MDLSQKATLLSHSAQCFMYSWPLPSTEKCTSYASERQPGNVGGKWLAGAFFLFSFHFVNEFLGNQGRRTIVETQKDEVEAASRPRGAGLCSPHVVLALQQFMAIDEAGGWASALESRRHT